MSSLSSDKSFFDFVKRSGGMWKFILPMALGILLIVFGVYGGQRSDSVTASVADGEALAELCSAVEGVGECRAVINRSDSGEICGVVILCDGADSVAVRLRLTELVRALLGVGANKICIEKINGERTGGG